MVNTQTQDITLVRASADRNIRITSFIKFPFSKKLTDDERISVIKSLSKRRNIPRDIDISLYEKILGIRTIFSNYSASHKYDACLSTLNDRDYIHLNLSFKNDTEMQQFADEVGCSIL